MHSCLLMQRQILPNLLRQLIPDYSMVESNSRSRSKESIDMAGKLTKEVLQQVGQDRTHGGAYSPTPPFSPSPPRCLPTTSYTPDTTSYAPATSGAMMGDWGYPQYPAQQVHQSRTTSTDEMAWFLGQPSQQPSDLQASRQDLTLP